jgi:hypothetical protein
MPLATIKPARNNVTAARMKWLIGDKISSQDSGRTP